MIRRPHALRRPAAALLTLALASAPGMAWAEGGMPQLDFKNPLTISQVVWGALIFIVLYILVSRFALPRVGQVLDLRAATIRNDLDTARAAKERADAAVAEMAAATALARAEAQAAITTAVEQARAHAAVEAAAMNAKLETQIASAEARIGAARAAAMGALRDVALSTASNVVARLTGMAANEPAVAGAVDQALAARRQG